MHKQTYNLRKKNERCKNDLLVDGFVYTGEHKDPVRINFVQYDGLNYKQKELSADDNFSMIFQPGKVNWMHVSGLSDTALISRIGKMLKMHSTVFKTYLPVNILQKLISTV